MRSRLATRTSRHAVMWTSMMNVGTMRRLRSEVWRMFEQEAHGAWRLLYTCYTIHAFSTE